MTQAGDVVVGVDGSECAEEALRWAQREARLHGWSVTALLAWDFVDQHHRDPRARFDPGYRHDDAADALDAYVDRALVDGATAIDHRVVCDTPARALIEAARSARLLVVGSRGRGGFRELLMGSVSQQCLHHAACPVAVVRRGATENPHGVDRIVVGVDGSPTSLAALQWAIDEAVVRGGVVDAVTVWLIPYTAVDPGAMGLYDAPVFEVAAREELDAAIASVDARRLQHPVQQRVVSGSAAEQIVDAANGADLVVLGSRGRGGFAELLLGSVTHQVAHHATCPVVVVPPSAARGVRPHTSTGHAAAGPSAEHDG